MGTRIIYLVRHGQMAKGDPPDELENGLTRLALNSHLCFEPCVLRIDL